MILEKRYLLVTALIMSVGPLSGCSHPEDALTRGYWIFQKVEIPKVVDANLFSELSTTSLNLWNNRQITKFDDNTQNRALGMIAEKRYGALLAYPQLRFAAKKLTLTAGDGKSRPESVDHYVRKGQTITTFVLKNGVSFQQNYHLTNQDQTLIQDLEDGFKAVYQHHS